MIVMSFGMIDGLVIEKSCIRALRERSCGICGLGLLMAGLGQLIRESIMDNFLDFDGFYTRGGLVTGFFTLRNRSGKRGRLVTSLKDQMAAKGEEWCKRYAKYPYLHKGDILLSYTDGVTEAINADKNLFSSIA